MTDHSSDSPRRRRRSGRHQQPARRRASPPLSPDEARRNRNAAFGASGEKRTWLGGSAASAPSAPSGASPAEATGSEAAAPEPGAARPPRAEVEPPAGQSEGRARGRRAAFPLEQLAHSPAAGGQSPAAGAQSPAAAADDLDADPAAARSGDAGGTGGAAPGARGRRRAALPAEPAAEQDVWAATSPRTPAAAASAPVSPTHAAPRATDDARPADEDRESSGSLPKVAFWTVLTSLLPGSGLVTTRMRRLGWVLLTVVLLALVVICAFLLFGDPLRTGMMLLTQRGILIGAMIALGAVGLLWALQIVLANLAHSTRERLAGAKRSLALALAALMVVAVAVPATRGVQSLWALQGLVGSRTVFGGGEGGAHPFTSGEDPWANAGRVNIMLLGQDAGVTRTGTRPDTIMVASIDTASGRTALFSIPRNLEKVQFPEGTPAAEVFPDGFDYFGPDQSLINAVWTWADDRPDLFPNDPEPGLTVTRWAVEETLGLQMDYYAMVNLQGFEDLVNALGGVDLVVERRIPIGGGASAIDGYIEPGMQKLDGFHALWYARSREGSNDFNRMCRQQRIVRAVTEEADPTTLALSIPGLVNATEDNIQTDIPVKNLDAFVDLALRIKDAGFTSYPITQDVTFSGDPDYAYLEEWVQASIEDSMTQESPESVLGETEPGSTAPAETGAPPEEEESAGTETPPEDEQPTSAEESSTPTDAVGSGEESTPAPEIEQDPLQSCLPGAEQ
ncbi:transcriptional regulator [Brachybacterium vulturis]|uniref:Transcriptional regulator n=1 Tax=Brachybacterium vulturis TaxID=2017484 RepID=A0A291GR03_9MICO|nr:LCP family protein [Brachybacterium vulturis]ATG52671.1 transcriptional regulator [Brachybacterium vulturis]